MVNVSRQTNLTCSKHLYRFKVFLDPRRAHLSSAVSLEVRWRKITYSVFFVVLALTSTPLHHLPCDAG